MTRVEYKCLSCGEISWRKETELPPERCWLCNATMFIRPTAEDMEKPTKLDFIQRVYQHEGVFWNGRIRFVCAEQPNAPHFLEPSEWERMGEPERIWVRVEPEDLHG